MMRDRDIPIEKINATGFNDYDLSRLVGRYNGDNASRLPSGSSAKKGKTSFTIGIKGGSYSSTLKYNRGEYAGYTFDPHSASIFNIYGNIGITDKFFIQPEFYVVSKGGKYSHTLQGNNDEREMNFDYLFKSTQISLNLRYNFLTGRFTPYILGGFCFSAAIDPKKTYRQKVYENYTIPYESIHLDSETGYRGAIGVNYRLFKTWQVSVEGLFEHTKIHSLSDDQFYNNGLGILAGIGYSFGNSSK
jgi:hypothetical protein